MLLRRGRLLATLLIPATLGAVLYACDDHPVSLLPVECDPTVGPDDLLWCEPKHDAGAPDAPDVTRPARCDCVPDVTWDFDGPGLFWVGPRNEAPQCPAVTPTFDREGWMDLASPPAVCDMCQCAASGQCTTVPSTITVRPAPCNAPANSTLPFDGPAGWDGSCTDANAIPAGATCPDGSSTLCVQSIDVGPLGGPEGEACSPIPPGPPELPEATWGTYALMCKRSDDLITTGCPGNKACAPPLDEAPPGWRQCIRRDGNRKCPLGWYGPRFLMYEEGAIIDDRKCSDCSCGAPSGGLCVGRFTAYEGPSCQAIVADLYPLKSTGPTCLEPIMPGVALASKSVTDLAYMPGTCGAAGGAPEGAATPDPIGVTTVCCQRDPEPVP